MSVELYAEEIVVVAMGEGPSDFKIWLREETPDDLEGDLRWLCEDDLDCHVVLDLARVETFDSHTVASLLALRDFAVECDFRLVLCSMSGHLKRQLECLHLGREFDTLDTREAAIRGLAPGSPEPQRDLPPVF